MTFSSLSKIRLLYNKSQQKVQKKKSCPNGEFGWVIVITSLLITIILDGYAYTCGQFYEQFLLIYGHNQAITSLYISIMNGTIYCISPLASALVNVFGCRVISIAGTVLAMIGMILSTIIDYSFYAHCFTIGFLTGTGLGLLYIAQIVILVFWFDEKLALAAGIAECGAGFGMAIYAVISSNLIALYTWKGAMIILAGLMSTGLALSALYTEPACKYPLKKESLFSTKLLIQVLKEATNFSLLCNDKPFLLFILSQAILNLVAFIPIIVISDRMTNLGFINSVWIYAIFGFTNGFGRILFGVIASFLPGHTLTLLIMATTGLGVSMLITNFAKNFTSMAIYYATVGLFFGGNICLCPVFLVDLLGQNKLANSLGIYSFFCGIALLIGPPLINLTVPSKDMEKSNDIYANSMIISGTIALISVVFLIPLYMLPSNSNVISQTEYSHTTDKEPVKDN